MKTETVLLVAGLTLVGCAAPIPPPSGPTPAEVRASGITRSEVHWGGQIVKVDNQRDRTLIEVLSLPLDSHGEPRTDQRPQGRFIVDKSGFLEPNEYAPGSLIEVRGRLDGFADGKVGDSPYRYPVVVGERLKLWASSAGGGSAGSDFWDRFRIGVGSGGGSDGGIRIGF